MSHSDDEEINDEDDQLPQLDTADADGSITSVPTLRYYQKRYAGTLSDNDQKAVRLFKEYENLEMVRRLQSELLWVANGQVYEQALDSNIGKKRKGRYKTYAEWAKLMLQWLAQAKR
jgi:hypothetical protein